MPDVTDAAIMNQAHRRSSAPRWAVDGSPRANQSFTPRAPADVYAASDAFGSTAAAAAVADLEAGNAFGPHSYSSPIPARVMAAAPSMAPTRLVAVPVASAAAAGVAKQKKKKRGGPVRPPARPAGGAFPGDDAAFEC